MAAVRGSSEPSYTRPVGGIGYVVLEFTCQLFGEGERLRQGTPWLSWVPQTCLNLLQIMCGTFQVLAELAEVAETGFVCPRGGG